MIDAAPMSGVPIEWLFGVIAGLIALVYADIRSSLKRVEKGSRYHDRILDKICEKLSIPFNNSGD